MYTLQRTQHTYNVKMFIDEKTQQNALTNFVCQNQMLKGGIHLNCIICLFSFKDCLSFSIYKIWKDIAYSYLQCCMRIYNIVDHRVDILRKIDMYHRVFPNKLFALYCYGIGRLIIVYVYSENAYVFVFCRQLFSNFKLFKYKFKGKSNEASTVVVNLLLHQDGLWSVRR